MGGNLIKRGVIGWSRFLFPIEFTFPPCKLQSPWKDWARETLLMAAVKIILHMCITLL